MQILSAEYGSNRSGEKFDRWFELDPPDLCVPVEYHALLREVEGTYIRGDFYPALTGACCLGERILNHLIFGLKEYYKNSPRYKEVTRKESIQDWEKGILILIDWRILGPEIAGNFKKLLDLRNPAVHFGQVEDRLSRAQTALQLVYRITSSLFGRGIPQFFWAPGEIYVKKVYESNPFTKEFIIPHCLFVGYRHRIENKGGQWVVVDDQTYEDRGITDEEFTQMRFQWLGRAG